jgi:hypothetical protein
MYSPEIAEKLSRASRKLLRKTEEIEYSAKAPPEGEL